MSAVAKGRRFGWREVVFFGWALTAAMGCQPAPEDGAVVEVSWSRQRLPALAPAEQSQRGRCAAGQLCEAPEQYLGLRVPSACRFEQRGKYVFVCWLPGVKMAELQAFYQSRQAHITVTGGKDHNARLQVRPSAPDPVHPDRQPLLVAEARSEGVRLTGTAASDPEEFLLARNHALAEQRKQQALPSLRTAWVLLQEALPPGYLVGRPVRRWTRSIHRLFRLALCPLVRPVPAWTPQSCLPAVAKSKALPPKSPVRRPGPPPGR
jgi:hypothetical protein